MVKLVNIHLINQRNYNRKQPSHEHGDSSIFGIYIAAIYMTAEREDCHIYMYTARFYFAAIYITAERDDCHIYMYNYGTPITTPLSASCSPLVRRVNRVPQDSANNIGTVVGENVLKPWNEFKCETSIVVLIVITKHIMFHGQFIQLDCNRRFFVKCVTFRSLWLQLINIIVSSVQLNLRTIIMHVSNFKRR